MTNYRWSKQKNLILGGLLVICSILNWFICFFNNYIGAKFIYTVLNLTEYKDKIKLLPNCPTIILHSLNKIKFDKIDYINLPSFFSCFNCKEKKDPKDLIENT